MEVMKRNLLLFLMCLLCGTMSAQNDSVLLVYFSRAGENWNMKNGNEVGPVERGNTAVLYIQDATARFCSFSAPERKVTF